MLRLLAVAICAAGFSLSAYAVTHGECAHEYDKCKKKPEHIFDKGPCRKERSQCDLLASRMDPNAKTKEAARRRIAERKRLAEMGLQEENAGTMRERVGIVRGVSTDEQTVKLSPEMARKAEAMRRMKERQRAQNGVAPESKPRGSMLDSIKGN